MFSSKPFLQYQLSKKRIAKSSAEMSVQDYPDVGTQMIGNGEDTIESWVFFERADEVHCDRLTLFIWDRQGMQGTWQLGGGRFISLEVSTGQNVSLFKIVLHVGPVVIIF